MLNVQWGQRSAAAAPSGKYHALQWTEDERGVLPMAGVDNATFWNRSARKYAASPIKDMAGYERTLDRTVALLRNADRVLELGCGTGLTALRIAPHVGRIIAIDVAAEMIAIGREKAAQAACANIEFLTAPSQSPPGGDGEFDAVLAFNLLHLTEDRAGTLAQALRVLKPGGLFISKTPCLSEMNVLIRWAVPLAQWLGKAPYVSFFDASGLALEIESAGFDILEQARHGSGKNEPRIFIAARKRA